MGIKTSFSIKDLENLSGVKAHTIRIWEKRYDLLSPERSDTNIRTYDQVDLRKLLNISLLNRKGFKVSKIAELNENELYLKVRELTVGKNDGIDALNSFKLSMLNFDQHSFDKTFNQLLAQMSFREIFLEVFLKLLEEIGLLWMSKTITPAHEHFISTLIKQKLLTNIERVQNGSNYSGKNFVLFLPINEIHELGLLYVHFELLLKGHRSVYLGPSVPIENLLELQKVFNDVTFVSYFTVQPSIDEVDNYLTQISKSILSHKGEQLHIIGRNTKHLNTSGLPGGIIKHDDLINLLGSL